MRHARDTLYWPSIHHDVKYLCDNCSICRETKPEKTQRKTMQSQAYSKKEGGKIISSDLFQCNLIVVGNLKKVLGTWIS